MTLASITCILTRFSATAEIARGIWRSLSDLARLAGTGRGVLIRSSRKVTSITPMQRIRGIRMEEARGLIAFAHMNFSQIADYLGYTRIHEFSREFAANHQKSPREFKQSLCRPNK